MDRPTPATLVPALFVATLAVSACFDTPVDGSAPSTTEGDGLGTETLGADSDRADCCAPDGHSTPGCDDRVCESLVCQSDAFCCDEVWDTTCSDLARSACGGCEDSTTERPGPDSGDTSTSGGGTSDASTTGASTTGTSTTGTDDSTEGSSTDGDASSSGDSSTDGTSSTGDETSTDGESSTGDLECGGMPPNACGGCRLLAGDPGDACGSCSAGQMTCAGANALACVGDVSANACGGCEPLATSPPGTSCGPCGLDVYVCEGSSATVCSGETTANDCGGCSDLADQPGVACGPCGIDTVVCAGPEATTCGGNTGANACGGCSALPNAPGSACGPCGFDTYACAGPDTTACVGFTTANDCGGCSQLPNPPGASCGACGLDDYVCTSAESTSCDGNTTANACGGCSQLSNPPGASCGSCGLDDYVCTSPESTSCDGNTTGNACGGCGTLANPPGGACGACLLDNYVCLGSETTGCDGNTPCPCEDEYSVTQYECPTRSNADGTGLGGGELMEVCGTTHAATGQMTISARKWDGTTFGDRPYQVRVSDPSDGPCGPNNPGFAIAYEGVPPFGVGTDELTFSFPSVWLPGQTGKAYCVTASTVPTDLGYDGSASQASWWWSEKVEVQRTTNCQGAVLGDVDGFDYPVGMPIGLGGDGYVSQAVDGDAYYNAQDFAEDAVGLGPHCGEDWNAEDFADSGDPVYAAANGIVDFVGSGGPGWGDIIVVTHTIPGAGAAGWDVVQTQYAHLSDIGVDVGDYVARGTQLGAIGDADGAYAPHLHFELRVDESLPPGGAGYGCADETSGMTDPSDFIDAHRVWP